MRSKEGKSTCESCRGKGCGSCHGRGCVTRCPACGNDAVETITEQAKVFSCGACDHEFSENGAIIESEEKPVAVSGK